MGYKQKRFRLLWCIFFAMAALVSSSPRKDAVFFSGKSEVGLRGGRYLLGRLDDYNDPSANRGHDPRTKVGSGGGAGGRRSRGTPDAP